MPLFNGNRRRESLDLVEGGLLHLSDKLARITAEAFNIASLSLGIDRIHRQRSFSTATHAAADGHGITWYGDVDPLEIVLSCPADTNFS